MTDNKSGRAAGLSTRAIHGRQKPDPTTGAVITPIFATSTFLQSSPGVNTGWEYSRSGNPTRAAFEAALAELEGGAAGFAFASGLAAEAAVLELLDHGAHLVASDDLYGGSWRLFHRVRERSAGLTVTHVDASDRAAIEAAIKSGRTVRRTGARRARGGRRFRSWAWHGSPPRGWRRLSKGQAGPDDCDLLASSRKPQLVHHDRSVHPGGARISGRSSWGRAGLRGVLT